MALNRTSWLTGIVVLIHQAAFGLANQTVLPVIYGQYGRAVAVGTHNSLVIWTDYRRTMDMSSEIYGTRVDLSGQPLDGDGIPLTGLVRGGAGVAALKNQFLIVWAKDATIYARRMTSAGELLDAQPIIVTDNPSHPNPSYAHADISVAADGTNFWVAWTETRKGQDIYAARVSPRGRVLDPRGIPICTRQGNQNTPRLSQRADFIAWVDSRPIRRSIFGARLHPKGFSRDANGFPIMSTTNQYSNLADVSGNGRNWLVLWHDREGIYANEVGRRAAISAPLVIERMEDPRFPQVEANGQDYLVVWQAGASVIARRVDAAKAVSGIIPLASDPTGSAYFSFGGFAGNGDRFCVTGTTAAVNATWMYNDVWFGNFEASTLP